MLQWARQAAPGQEGLSLHKPKDEVVCLAAVWWRGWGRKILEGEGPEVRFWP